MARSVKAAAASVAARQARKAEIGARLAAQQVADAKAKRKQHGTQREMAQVPPVGTDWDIEIVAGRAEERFPAADPPAEVPAPRLTFDDVVLVMAMHMLDPPYTSDAVGNVVRVKIQRRALAAVEALGWTLRET